MKARFVALLVIIAVLLLLPVTAAGEDNGSTMLIDDMSSSTSWSSVSGEASAVRYGTETEDLASGEGDTGYLAVRNNDTVSGTPLEISRSFDEPLNLYGFNNIGFYINISDTGLEGAVYDVTVTLYSRGPLYSYSDECHAGGWVRFSASVGDYSLRTDIVGISVSVTVRTTEPQNVRLSYRLDGIVAETPRNTAAEDRFLCSAFGSRGGQLVADDGGALVLSYSSGRGRITGEPTIKNRQNEYDMIRFTVSSDSDVESSLTVTYFGGEQYTTESIRLPGGGAATALVFSVENIVNIYSFSLNIYGEGEGALRLLGVELAALPEPMVSGVGTLDTCRVMADGSVNLRGTVPSGVVADYMGGDIAVFCVPVYEDAAEFISDAEPCYVRAVTTRFDMTIEKEALPAGYRAMRFVTAIIYDGERTILSQPKLPMFSEEAGAVLPSRRAGIKGIAYTDSGYGSAVTFIDADLSKLFGSASSGRLYSFSGKIYYFDNGYIAELDEKIRSASLSGTACFLRLFSSNPRGGYGMLSVDNEEDFSRVYSAVDYLTSRYSSEDYGYVSGIAVGMGVYSDRYERRATAESRVASEARTLSVVYQAGRGNIAGFGIILPVEDRLADTSSFDAAKMLLGLSSREDFSVPYSVMISSEKPTELADVVLAYTSALGGRGPDGLYAVYTPQSVTDEKLLLADYLRLYYEACMRADIKGFVLSPESEQFSAEFRDNFYLIDTNDYDMATAYAGFAATNGVPERSHPVTITRGRVGGEPGDVVGRCNLFDFTGSYDTAGWFAVSGEGECLTVRTDSGRALRADAGSLGAMYSCVSAPRDLSETPILSIEAYSPDAAEYVLTVYSTEGVFRAALSLWPYGSTYCVDLSDFSGVGSVTGISVTPENGGGTLYLSRISVLSRTLDDASIRDMFITDAPGGQLTAGEDHMLEIMAISLLSLAVGVAVFAFAGSRERRRRRENE